MILLPGGQRPVMWCPFIQVIRTDTVFDQLCYLARGSRVKAEIQREAEKILLGQVVITRYNNRTYK